MGVTYAAAARSSGVTAQATKPVNSSVAVSTASNRVVNLPSTGGSSVSGIFDICESAPRRLLAEGNDSSAVLGLAL